MTGILSESAPSGHESLPDVPAPAVRHARLCWRRRGATISPRSGCLARRLTGEHASVEQQSIAATAFTALVDALRISLFALRPGNNIPTASLVLGLIGLTSTAGLTIRLWRARRREELSNRWPFLLLAITGLYGYQT